MKIDKINNSQYNFNARLPLEQIKMIHANAEAISRHVSRFSQDEATIVPKLYTLLKLLDKFPGEKATIESETIVSKYYAMGRRPTSTIHKLKIDDKFITNSEFGPFTLLKSLLTDYTAKDGRRISMPDSIFDKMWWVNRSKTKEDLVKLAYKEPK